MEENFNFFAAVITAATANCLNKFVYLESDIPR